MSVRVGYKTTDLGEVPEDWESLKIEDKKLSRLLKAGGTPLRTVKEYYANGTVPFVRIEDITKNHKYIADTEMKITKLGLENSSTWLVPENSLLFSMYASFGEVVITKIPVATNQAIIALTPSNEFDIDFLYYVLSGLKPKLRRFLRETTQKNLNAEIVRNLRIPFPPAPERLKIASILSTVDNAIQKTGEIVDKTQQLKKGLIQQLLTKGVKDARIKQTEIGELPEEWEVVNCEDLCNEITVGIVVTPAKYYIESGVPCLRSFNILQNEIDPSDLVYISPEANELHEKSVLHKGDVVTVRTGKPGMSCVVPDSFDGANCIDLIILRPNEQVNSDFLSRFLNSDAAKRQITSWQAGSMQVHLNVGVAKKLRIPLPDKREQQEIVGVLASVDGKLAKEKQEIEHLNSLKKGLMHVLLTGKVRVKVN
jgi:type I restriction enzyme S subunit